MLNNLLFTGKNASSYIRMKQQYFLLAFLYSLQGVPFGLQANLLPLILRHHGLKLWHLSIIHMLSLPWLLKGIIATRLVNRVSYRRAWICCSLGATGLCFILLEMVLKSFTLVCVVLLACSFSAAVMDIAVDAVAMTIATNHNVGTCNSIQIVAYKLGLMSTSALYVLFGHLPAYILACVYIASAILVHLFLRASAAEHAEFPTRVESTSLAHLCVITRRSLPLVVFCVCYKAGEKGFSTLFPTYLVDRGLGIADVSFVSGVLGQIASMIGSIIGGFYCHSHHAVQSAFVGVSVAMVAHVYASTWSRIELLPYICIEIAFDLCSGFITTWTFSYMMTSAKKFDENLQAVHYSLFSTYELSGKLLFSTLAGILGQHCGYFMFFAICCILQLIPNVLVGSFQHKHVT